MTFEGVVGAQCGRAMWVLCVGRRTPFQFREADFLARVIVLLHEFPLSAISILPPYPL